MKQFRRMWQQAESGYTVTVQAIYYVFVLYLFFALIYDFGQAGYVFTVASNAARMAAQDAAKNIDEDIFVIDQEVRLNDGALASAQEVADTMTGGRMTITSLRVSELDARDVIVVQGTAVAHLPILGAAFGMPTISIPVEGYAEPAYGIAEEGQ
jgi:hypothetical protein